MVFACESVATKFVSTLPEIQFSNDATFNSIGKRIFDISIQGKVVWKDFNIAEKAGGFGKGITLERDVNVYGSTLEIHLYWAGKGTTAVPDRGVYGPLISAISATPKFGVKTGGLSTGTIVGIVVISLLSLALILVVLWISGFLGGTDVEDKELRGAIEKQTGYFSLRHIRAATSNFASENKIGEGGFGPVYKGILPDGLEIAVKQLSSKSKQGNREFINEIGIISALKHPNLVKLYGCCIEGNQLLLIYEYLENNCLARALFGRDGQQLNLDWTTRKKILLGIARGLSYLHEESRLKIVHRDIKATNVLLDKDLNEKISDFGLAKLDEEEKTHITTRIAGTVFDMDGYVTGFGNPDWAQTHSPALSTAPAVMAVLRAGATCVGKTVMDEMAYSINGENVHYGTPTNPCAPDRVPGGSSSGSAVGVGASLVDFSLGTDTGGSIRVPASYCGIFGFRPSHGAVSTTGVTPMAQSFDTAGWFARDPLILSRVGSTLLQLPDHGLARPSKIIIAEDCFKLLSFPSGRITNVLVEAVKQIYGDDILNYANLGKTVERDVPSLKKFMCKDLQNHEYNIEPLVALSNAMRLLQRYEFRNNHGEWVKTVKPHLGPGIAERVWEAINTKDDNIDACFLVKTELQAALRGLLGDLDVLAIPTVPGPPPKLKTEAASLETFRVRAFSLLSVAGVSGFCQVSIPLGMYDNLPVSVSLLARNGCDKFLLNVVETLYGSLKEQVQIAEEVTS